MIDGRTMAPTTKAIGTHAAVVFHVLATDPRIDRLKPTPRFVYAAAAHAADFAMNTDAGYTALTVVDVMRFTGGLSVSATGQALNALEKHGYLRRLENGPGRARRYRLSEAVESFVNA